MYRDKIRGEFTLIKAKFSSAISELSTISKKANLFQAIHLQEKYFFGFFSKGGLLL